MGSVTDAGGKPNKKQRRESQRHPQKYYLERIKVQILQGVTSVVPETLSETVKARKQ